jgi:hypothetical protein
MSPGSQTKRAATFGSTSTGTSTVAADSLVAPISAGHLVRERSGTALDGDIGTGDEYRLVRVIPADLESPVSFVAEDLDDLATAFRLADLL